jgi:mannose-6-phosphate isomerase-like protein (cupin superfamily)
MLLLFSTALLCDAQERTPVQGTPAQGDHSKVPPARVPSPYMSAADIQAGLNKLDPKIVSGYGGGSVTIAQGMNAVVRRRVTGPQYAITHTRELEYIVVTKGSGTMVTGGTLIPPTIDSDIYPNPDPNATIRSLRGVKDGLARKIGVGDVIINPPGTPHWLSEIDGVIEYVEIRIPNVDPAPGVERAEVGAARAK